MKNIEDKIRKLFSESNKTSIELNIYLLKEINKSILKIDEQISKIESKSHLFKTYDEQHGFAELKDHINHIKNERFKSLVKNFTGETI